MSDISIHIPVWAVLAYVLVAFFPAPVILLLPVRIWKRPGRTRLLAVVSVLSALATATSFLTATGDPGF